MTDKANTDQKTNSFKTHPLLVSVLLVVILGTFAWNLQKGISIWFDDDSAPLHLMGIGQQSDQGFDLNDLTIPINEVLRGGPRKDGIPALSNPAFLTAKDADYLEPSDRIIGFISGDESRAYPLKILNYHEVVNDTVAGVPIAVTYCPLCDSALIIDRRSPVGLREFGVSGLLYNSNVLMYDRSDSVESLWSQIKCEAVSGPAATKQLQALPLELVTWKEWIDRFPDTLVLDSNTGHARDYSRSPYAEYFRGSGLMFPVARENKQLPNKEQVLGVWLDRTFRAYPILTFENKSGIIRDVIDNQEIMIEYSSDSGSMRIIEAPATLQWMYSFWFAWYAMNPETEVYSPSME